MFDLFSQRLHSHLTYRFNKGQQHFFIAAHAVLFIAFSLSAHAQQVDENDILDFIPAIIAGSLSDSEHNSGNTQKPPTSTNTGSLCRGFLVNDKTNRPMTHLPKPAPRTTYTDPVFGSKITRISNADAINSGVIKTLYSTIQAWNADESRLILWHRGVGHFLYHGKTYALIEQLDITPADIEQVFWSTTNPNVLVYPNNAVGTNVTTHNGNYRLRGKELIEYNIATKHYRVVNDFNALCTDNITGGNDIQMPSYNGDLIGLSCGDKHFTYQRSTNHITLLPSGNLSSIQQRYTPQPFPSGQRSYHYDTVRNRSLAVERTFHLGRPDEHASLGRMHNGNDAYFATAFDATTDGSCNGGIGSLVVHDANNGNCRVLVGQRTGYPYTLSGTHVSAVANKKPGWAAVSSVGYDSNGDSLLEQELYLANTDPNNLQVCRIAHHRSAARHGSTGYFAEPHPVLSPSGTRVLFSSDWNNSGKVDVYVVELPVYP